MAHPHHNGSLFPVFSSDRDSGEVEHVEDIGDIKLIRKGEPIMSIAESGVRDSRVEREYHSALDDYPCRPMVRSSARTRHPIRCLPVHRGEKNHNRTFRLHKYQGSRAQT